MNERWKYQVKYGFFFAIFIVLFNALFEYREQSFVHKLSTLVFWLKFLVLLILSIFVLGYFSWKSKGGKDYAWSDLFGKNKK